MPPTATAESGPTALPRRPGAGEAVREGSALGFAILAHEERVGYARFAESLRTKHAAIAGAAGSAIRQRIVAAVRATVIEAERVAVADDLGFAHREERRVNAEAAALDTGAGAEIGDPLEGTDELGTAVGVPRIVERVDADDDVARVERLGPAERQRQENRLSCRNGCWWDPVGGDVSSVRHRVVRGEGRSAECAQVDRELDVSLDVERARDRP